METVTVKSCEKTGTKNYNGKDYDTFKVTFTDGVVAQSFGKAIPEGTPITDLEIKESQYGKNVKMINKGGGGGRQVRRENNAAFAMSYAKDLAIAGKVEMKDLLSTAEKIFNWIESHPSKNQ